MYEIQSITGTPNIVKVGDAADYTMGTLFFNERGQLFSYGISSATGGNQVNFYYINKANGHVTQIGSSESSPQSDGCECAYRLSLTLTAGDDQGNVSIPNCSKPSDFDIHFSANNTASGAFSGVTFDFPLDRRFTFADTQSEIETYLKDKFGSSVSVSLSDVNGGTNNKLHVTGIAVDGTTANSGNPVAAPFSFTVTAVAGGNEFSNGEKVDFQAEFGGLSSYYGTTEPSSDPLSLYGKKASTITFNKSDGLCNTLSGNVLHDITGLSNGKVDGDNITTDLALKAVLVNSSNVIIGVTTVSTANGTYSFLVGPGTYSVVLTAATADQTKIGKNVSEVTVQQPSGWLFTGEHLGLDDGSDSDPNGVLAGIILESANVTNANFGIQIPPAASNSSYTIGDAPASGTSIPLNGTVTAISGSGASVSTPKGSDTDASQDAPFSFVITSLPTTSGGTPTGSAPDLYYNGSKVTATDVTSGTVFSDPALFSLKLNGAGYMGVSFGFETIDAAGSKSATATYSLSWESALPVTLIRFSAERGEGRGVALSWVTSQETNASHFEVERSGDARLWATVQRVSAKGESKITTEYKSVDKDPSDGVNYYRLKMVDADSTYTYSKKVSVRFAESPLALRLYPNPASEVLHIDGLSAESVRYVSVIAVTGRVVFRSERIPAEGIALHRIPGGVYLLKVTTKSGAVLTRKIIIGNK